MESLHTEIDIDSSCNDSRVEVAMHKIAGLANFIAAHYMLNGKRTAVDPVVQSLMNVALHAEGIEKFLNGQAEPKVLTVPRMVMGQRPS